MRKFLLIAVAPMLLIGGGTALAASNAPGSGAHAPLVHPKSVVRAAGEGLAPIELWHLQNPPETPAPTPSPSVVVTQPPAPAPTASSPSPSHTSAPAPKPRPTPIVIIPPPPTPAPTPAPVIDSGALPPINVDFSNGTTWSGDNYSNSWQCAGYANCLPQLTFNIPAWGNYDLSISYTETVDYVTTTGGIFHFITTNTGSIGGYGPNSGGSNLGMTFSGGNNSMSLTITVSWGPPPS